MSESPETHELLAAVRGFVETRAMPALEGHAAYSARVAANVLAIAEREVTLGPAAEAAERARLAALLGREGTRDDLNDELCAAIRRGDVTLDTPGLLPHLRATLIDRLAIDQPRYSGYRAVLAARQAGEDAPAISRPSDR